MATEIARNRGFRLPHYRTYVYEGPRHGTPKNTRMKLNLIPSESRVLGYIFAADSIGLSSFRFPWLAPKDANFSYTTSVLSQL